MRHPPKLCMLPNFTQPSHSKQQPEYPAKTVLDVRYRYNDPWTVMETAP